ncbi:hypothetical protein EHV23_15070 [Lautropia dentalis]|uniref:Uncharacterized protein n=1 Tax=Lautropia dentalis TaxID=2490857 RepID=A0A426FLI6_9BURK|nr:hypothetical protein EHV23_15070 [Lautropia dentalis]
MDDLLTLRLRQQRQPGQRAGLIGHHRRQQHLQVPQPPFHRGPLEQHRAVLHHPLQPPISLTQRQCQIKVRRIMPEFLLPQRQPRQLQLDFCIVLQRQHHLEQRAVAHVPLRTHRLHHLLERHVLMPIPCQRAVLDLRQQLCHRRLPVQPRTQRQRVHEEPDQPFQLAPSAVGHRCAHHHIVLAAQPAHQHRKPGLQHHEQRRTVPPGQRVEPLRGAFVQIERYDAAGKALHLRPRMIRRQLQQRWRA